MLTLFRIRTGSAGLSLTTAGFLAVISSAFAADPAPSARVDVAPGDVTSEIVVTASPLTGDPDGFATIVSKVGRDDIVKNGGSSLADALKDVPGVTGTSFAAGASRPVIRGFDANRVRILENGVGSFDVSDVGPDHGIPIDPLSAQSIEVVRGAATLRYGSQAIGGVVNAINNRVPLVLPDKAIAGELTGTYGTNADLRQGSALIDLRVGPYAIHADGFGRKTDDYEIPGGTQSNSFFEGHGYSVGGSTFFGGEQKSRIGGAFIHYDAQYGIPGEESFIDMRQNKGLFGSSFALDKGPLQTVTLDAGYADYTHSEIVPGQGPAATFNDKEWDLRAESIFAAFGPFSAAAAGVQAQNRRFSALGEGADYLLPTETKTLAGFGFAEVPLAQRLKLQLGARVESVEVEGTPLTDVLTQRSYTPVSGSAGLLFEASDAVKLGLTVSSAARAPGQTELFARGPHEGTATFETGDPTLGIERANSIEGTLRVRRENIRFEGSLWAAKFHNYIFGRLTGRTCDDEGVCVEDSSEALKELFYEQRDATFWGLEGKATIPVFSSKAGALGFDLLGDYVRATLKGGDNVPRIPPFHVGAALTWASDIVDFGVRLTYAGAQTKVALAEGPTKGFISLDSQIAVRPFRKAAGLELAIVGTNLTNETRRNATAINKDDVILPGRDVRFVIRAAF